MRENSEFLGAGMVKEKDRNFCRVTITVLPATDEFLQSEVWRMNDILRPERTTSTIAATVQAALDLFMQLSEDKREKAIRAALKAKARV